MFLQHMYIHEHMPIHLYIRTKRGTDTTIDTHANFDNDRAIDIDIGTGVYEYTHRDEDKDKPRHTYRHIHLDRYLC